VVEQQLLTAREIEDRIEVLRERLKQKGTL
jgi:hypothetical protein